MLQDNKKSALGKSVESFKYAFDGLRYLIRSEPNVRIHFVASMIVIICGWYFDIDKGEWLAVILCIGIVLMTEIINTAIENICDYISPAQHHKIKIIKDLAAAAVLIGAAISVVIAGCIFGPRFLAVLP